MQTIKVYPFSALIVCVFTRKCVHDLKRFLNNNYSNNLFMFQLKVFGNKKFLIKVVVVGGDDCPDVYK